MRQPPNHRPSPPRPPVRSRTLPRLAACLLALATAPTALADRLDDVRSRDRLVVAVKNDRPGAGPRHRDPAHVQKRDYEVAVARALAAALVGDAAKLELRMVPKPRRLAVVAEGAADLGLSMFPVTTDPARPVEYSTPYFQDGLAVLERSGGTTARLEDLAGRRLAVLAQRSGGIDGRLASALAGAGLQAERVPVADFPAGMALVAEDRADALVATGVEIAIGLADAPPSLRASPLLTHERIGVAVPKGEPALLAAVNAALERLRASGELARMARAAGIPAENVPSR